MPAHACQSDCRDRAEHWRQRAAATAHAELRDAYLRIAESYECLITQALLCRRLVLVRAMLRGEPAPCQCGPDIIVSTLSEDVARREKLRETTRFAASPSNEADIWFNPIPASA